MPRSRMELLRTVATITTAVIAGAALCVATVCWCTAVADDDDGALRLAIGLTVLGVALGLVNAVVLLFARVEQCHDETRIQVEAIADRLARRIPDAVTLELYNVFANTIKEQLVAAETLTRAHRRWRSEVGADTPIDLRQWKTDRSG